MGLLYKQAQVVHRRRPSSVVVDYTLQTSPQKPPGQTLYVVTMCFLRNNWSHYLTFVQGHSFQSHCAEWNQISYSPSKDQGNGWCHMIHMSTMPTYDKNSNSRWHFNSLSVYVFWKVCLNDDHEMTFDLYSEKSDFVSHAFMRKASRTVG